VSHHPDAPWTHAVCDDCWFQDHYVPDTNGMVLLEDPVRLVDSIRKWEQCCRCGGMTFSGIYVRDDPASRTQGQWKYGYYCSSGATAREASS
jgi:hypothetical protein